MTVIEEIAAERRRQIEVEGFTAEHDDEHSLGEMALAAALYALPYEAKLGGEPLITQDDFIGLDTALSIGCKFDVKPIPNRRRRLVVATALIVAEIERIDRADGGQPNGR